MPQLGVAIWLVNLINGAFSFWQEYRAERATAALRRLLPARPASCGTGEERPVPAEALVPGDVLLLAEGDHISADARLVAGGRAAGRPVHPDRGVAPGAQDEPGPCRADGLARSEQPNLVFAGTTVAAGTGRAVVCATGMGTAFGTDRPPDPERGREPSPLQREMGRVTRIVAALATGIGVLFFVLAVALAGVDLAAGFVFAMGMIVAFVPEGMLPTVTLVAGHGRAADGRRHALVKRLSAVETLGCATVICTDKTGTLTQNEMTVRGAVGRRPPASRHRRRLRAGRADPGGGAPGPAARRPRRLIVRRVLAGRRLLLPPMPGCCRRPARRRAGWTVLGDPTEAALQVAARKAGLDLEAARRRAPAPARAALRSRGASG